MWLIGSGLRRAHLRATGSRAVDRCFTLRIGAENARRPRTLLRLFRKRIAEAFRYPSTRLRKLYSDFCALDSTVSPYLAHEFGLIVTVGDVHPIPAPARDRHRRRFLPTVPLTSGACIFSYSANRCSTRSRSEANRAAEQKYQVSHAQWIERRGLRLSCPESVATERGSLAYPQSLSASGDNKSLCRIPLEHAVIGVS